MGAYLILSLLGICAITVLAVPFSEENIKNKFTVGDNVFLNDRQAATQSCEECIKACDAGEAANAAACKAECVPPNCTVPAEGGEGGTGGTGGTTGGSVDTTISTTAGPENSSVTLRLSFVLLSCVTLPMMIFQMIK